METVNIDIGCGYMAHLRGLSDTALRAETIAAVTEANALCIESCRQQWITLGRAGVFLQCYNEAVDKMAVPVMRWIGERIDAIVSRGIK